MVMDVSDNKPVPYINWSTEQVVSWLKGLDGFVEDYVTNFKAKGVNGKWLNCVTPGELARFGVTKVGHQMIILDRIRQLQNQYSAFDNETLQMVLFRVSRSCVSIIAAVNAHTSIIERQDFRDPDADAVYPGILDDLQDAVTYILNCVLTLMSAVWNAAFWLDRSPFHTLPDMLALRKFLIERALLVNNTAQLAIANPLPTHFKEVLAHVKAVGDRVDGVIQGCNDSIMLTPCGMELVQLRKADATEFGFNLESTQNNVHWIAFVQQESPAFCSGKVARGDEVVEVNDQVVIGWQHRRVAELMRLHPKRISLRLRKRPTHTTDFSGFPGGGRRHRVVPPQQPTSVPTRYLRGRIPLTAAMPNASEPLESTREAANPQFLLSPVPDSNAIPEAQTPVYSQSSSSSSSRSPSIQFNEDLLQPGSHNLDPLSYGTVKSDTSHRSKLNGYSFGRLASSTPSTPFLNVRSKSKSESEQGPLASSVSPDGDLIHINVESMRKSPRLGDGKHESSESKTSFSSPTKSLFPRFTPTHRRTASGSPTLWNATSSQKDADHIETGSLRSETGRRPTAPILQALDKRSRNRAYAGSTGDISNLVFGTSSSATRQVSSKDLGNGDFCGWLWIKRSNVLLSKYAKRWCVFKDSTLYYFRHPEDSVADGLVNVNGFTVTPAPVVKYGRYPFYVYNDWIRFIFASETESERTKWMNVLGLASIDLSAINLHNASRIGGFGPGYVASEEDLPSRVTLRTKVSADPGLGPSPKLGWDTSPRSTERLRSITPSNPRPSKMSKSPMLGVKPLTPLVTTPYSVSRSGSSRTGQTAPCTTKTQQYFCGIPYRSPSMPSGLCYMESDDDEDFGEPLMERPCNTRLVASPTSPYSRGVSRSVGSPSVAFSPLSQRSPQSPQHSLHSKSSPSVSDTSSGRLKTNKCQLVLPVRDSRHRAKSSSPAAPCPRMRAATKHAASISPSNTKNSDA